MSAGLGRPHPSHVRYGAEGPVPAAVDSAAQRLASPVGARTDPPSGRIAVTLLGGLEVSGGGIRVGPRGLGGTKPRHVLLALLLHRGAPLAKDRLVDLLWDGRPPTGSMATLETYVCLLRKKLQPLHSPGPGPITTVAGCYAIDMARVDLDVDRYDRLVGTALRPEVSAVAALPMLREALSLGRAPLLPEEPDDGWLAEARRAHAHRMHRGLVEAAAKVAGLPNGDAVHWAEAALEVDPLDESAWLALLRSHEASGSTRTACAPTNGAAGCTPPSSAAHRAPGCRRPMSVSCVGPTRTTASSACCSTPSSGCTPPAVRGARGRTPCRAPTSRSDRGPPTRTSWSCTGCCTEPGPSTPHRDHRRLTRSGRTCYDKRLPGAPRCRHAHCDLPLDGSR